MDEFDPTEKEFAALDRAARREGAPLGRCLHGVGSGLASVFAAVRRRLVPGSVKAAREPADKCKPN